jgi:hypothetical protein
MNQINSDNPFLFACGVPRSGTTLLQRMLNSHPELAVANDSHFIPRALELTDKSLLNVAESGQPIPLTDELVNSIRRYHRFWRLGLSATNFEAVREQATTYQQLVAGLYACHAKDSGKKLAGEKTPDYVRRLSLLNGLFPSAKLIHLVRDGRNVALSLLQWATPRKGPGRIEMWEEHPVAVCALWWKWMVLESRRQAAEIDEAALIEISYEELVADPEKSMRDLCGFLDLKFSPQMTEFHKGKSKTDSSLSAKKAWLAPQSGLRNWAADMEPAELELFEALAGDALHAFGYPVHHSGFSSQTKEIAHGCETWWEENFLSRHRRSGPDATHPISATT